MLVGEAEQRASRDHPRRFVQAACLLRSCSRRGRLVAFRPDLSATPPDRSRATSRDRCRLPAGLAFEFRAVAFPDTSDPRSPDDTIRRCDSPSTHRANLISISGSIYESAYSI